jgi:hypothetical protein
MRVDNNSAHRLLKILQEASQQPENKPIQEVWANLFQTETADTPWIFRNLSALFDSTEEIERLVKRIPDKNHALFLKCLTPIRKGLSYPHMGNPWQSVRTCFAPEHLHGLEFCSDLLTEYYPEDQISGGELDEITKGINELFAEVNNSAIDAKLKALLLDLLETIRRCIAEYQIRGSKGIREAVTVALDTLSQHIRKKDGTSYSDKEKSLVAKFLTILSRTDEIAARALTYLPLLEKFPEWAESIKRYLPRD